MKLESNIIDPYTGQKAEGKIIDFESKKSIQVGFVLIGKAEDQVRFGEKYVYYPSCRTSRKNLFRLHQ